MAYTRQLVPLQSLCVLMFLHCVQTKNITYVCGPIRKAYWHKWLWQQCNGNLSIMVTILFLHFNMAKLNFKPQVCNESLHVALVRLWDQFWFTRDPIEAKWLVFSRNFYEVKECSAI